MPHNRLKSKFMPKSKGFTLMEIIIVIAILAILAAIAVPTITGYIERANQVADMQLAANLIDTASLAIHTSEVGITEDRIVEIAWSTNGRHSKDGSILVRSPVINSPFWKTSGGNPVEGLSNSDPSIYKLDKFISDTLRAEEGTQFPGYSDPYEYFLGDAKSKLCNDTSDFGFHLNTSTGEIAIAYECEEVWVNELGLPLISD